MPTIAGKLRVSAAYTQLPEDRFNVRPVRNSVNEFQITDDVNDMHELALEETHDYVDPEEAESDDSNCWCRDGKYFAQMNRAISFADRQSPEIPRVQINRNNLTALSQAYNLYFAAMSHRLYVYRPRTHLTQLIPAKADLLLYSCPTPEAMSVHGHQDSIRCHDANTIATGFLGAMEIVVTSHDDGDVVVYDTSHIEQYVRFLLANEGRHPKNPNGTIPYPQPIYRINVGLSAWGIAIHQKSRLIAISSNRHEVTVFAPASNGTKGLPVISPSISSQTKFINSSNEDLYIIISLRERVEQHLPSLEFIEDKEGFAIKVLVGALGGYLWVADIWERGTKPGYYHELLRAGSGVSCIWSITALSEDIFVPCSSHEEAMTSTMEPSRFKCSDKINRSKRILNITPLPIDPEQSMTYPMQEELRFYRIRTPSNYSLDLSSRDLTQTDASIYELRNSVWGTNYIPAGQSLFEEFQGLDLSFMYEEDEMGQSHSQNLEIQDSIREPDTGVGAHPTAAMAAELLRMSTDDYSVAPESINRVENDTVALRDKNGKIIVDKQILTTMTYNDPYPNEEVLSEIDPLIGLTKLKHSRVYIEGPRIAFSSVTQIGLYPKSHQDLVAFLRRKIMPLVTTKEQQLTELYKNGSPLRLLLGFSKEAVVMSPNTKDIAEDMVMYGGLSRPGEYPALGNPRVYLTATIPELSLVIVGNITGCVNMLTPTKVPNKFSQGRNDNIRYTFAVETQLPQWDDETGALMKGVSLIGLSCSPLFEEKEETHSYDDLHFCSRAQLYPGPGWRFDREGLDLDYLVPWRQRRKEKLFSMGAVSGKWRVMLYYDNHTIITYIVERGASGNIIVI
ncbi:CRT10 domain protein [Ceratocystis lukuohia]|uniref:CRT10 domain protein n=1 Tax=Ceratocystis lukuohia TaxID=2019550 RepID=A0ABR4MLL7_9PEZI